MRPRTGRFMWGQSYPQPHNHQASTRPRRLKAGTGLALLQAGALFPQRLPRRWAVKPIAAGGRFATRRGENETYTRPRTETKRLLRFITCAWSAWIFSNNQVPFCLSQSELCLSLITLPTSTQMWWQLCAGDRTRNFQGYPCKCDLRCITPLRDY